MSDRIEARDAGLNRSIDEGLLLDALHDTGGRRVLVVTASRHGSTREIGDAVAAALNAVGCTATSQDVDEVGSVVDYDVVVLGSAIYRGRWLPSASALVKRQRGALLERPVWLFSSGPVGDPDRRLVKTMGLATTELARLTAAIRPADHRLFPGRLEPADLSLPQRAAVRLVRLAGDFRDWPQIVAYADDIARTISTVSR